MTKTPRTDLKKSIKTINELMYLNPLKALKLAENGFKSHKEDSDSKGIYLYYCGVCNLFLSNYKLSLDCFLHSRSIFSRNNNINFEARILNGIGNVFSQLDNYNEALKYYLQSMELYKNQNNMKGLSVSYSSLGSIYGYLKQYNKAITFGKLALNLQNYSKTNYHNQIITINNIAAAYMYLGKYNMAIRYYNKAMRIPTLRSDKSAFCLVLKNISEINLLQRHYKKALFNIEKSMAMASDIENKDHLFDAFNIWARILINFKKYREIIEKSNTLRNINIASVSKQTLFEYYMTLAICYEKIGRLKRSLSFIKRALSYKEKLMDKESKLNTIKLMSLHKIEVDQKEFDRQSQVRFSRLLIEFQEKERKRISSELHDSIGQSLLILNNRLLLVKNKSNQKQIQKEINGLSHLTVMTLDEIRAITQNLRPFELDRLGLTDAITSLIKNFTNAGGIKMNVHIQNIDNLIPNKDEILVYRILQECLNNILKHSKAKSVTIQVKRNQQSITIKVIDFGVGFDFEEVKTNSSGIGVFNIIEKVEMLGGKIKLDSHISQGTKITVILPIKTNA